MVTEEVDESFEIISEKEKYWRDQLVKAETSYITAEANMVIGKAVMDIAKEEIKKEAEKNKPAMVD